MATKIFVNLSVKNLDASIKFFTHLGFTFNPQFTDTKATCMVVGENIFVMLLIEEFFKTFTSKDICDTASHAEAILALTVNSREEVDEIMILALAAGGVEPRAAQDHGFMYGRSFEDIDGHLWEVFYMEEQALEQ